jgi:hypothetical protein
MNRMCQRSHWFQTNHYFRLYRWFQKILKHQTTQTYRSYHLCPTTQLVHLYHPFRWFHLLLMFRYYRLIQTRPYRWFQKIQNYQKCPTILKHHQSRLFH